MHRNGLDRVVQIALPHRLCYTDKETPATVSFTKEVSSTVFNFLYFLVDFFQIFTVRGHFTFIGLEYVRRLQCTSQVYYIYLAL